MRRLSLGAFCVECVCGVKKRVLTVWEFRFELSFDKLRRAKTIFLWAQNKFRKRAALQLYEKVV